MANDVKRTNRSHEIKTKERPLDLGTKRLWQEHFQISPGYRIQAAGAGVARERGVWRGEADSSFFVTRTIVCHSRGPGIAILTALVSTFHLPWDRL